VAWNLKREVVRGSPLAHLYRKNPSLADALKELRAQLVDDPSLKAAVKAELRTLMNGLIGALSPKEWVRDPGDLTCFSNAVQTASGRAPDLPDYAAARQHFSAWLEDTKKSPEQSVRAQLAREFKGFLPRLISAYEDHRSFVLTGPPQPVTGPDLQDGCVYWLEVAESIREWGLGVLLDPRARQVLDEIDGETINRFLAIAESRKEFHSGRPPEDFEKLAREATEALEMSREYVAGLDPGERRESLTIYSEEEQAARKRAPSAEAAAHARAAKEIERSKRTARRRRAKSPR
jgi:hypothetical protein